MSTCSKSEGKLWTGIQNGQHWMQPRCYPLGPFQSASNWLCKRVCRVHRPPSSRSMGGFKGTGRGFKVWGGSGLALFFLPNPESTSLNWHRNRLLRKTDQMTTPLTICSLVKGTSYSKQYETQLRLSLPS